MNPGLVIFMILGILGGIAAAGTALYVGWGWLAALGLYCLVGALTLIGAAVLSVILAARASREKSVAAQDPASDPGFVQVLH